MSEYTVPFVFAKTLGIGYVTTLYFMFGIVMAKVFDYFYGEFDSRKHEKQGGSLFRLGAEIIAQMFLISVMIYILRNTISRIPFPLEGLGGYQHMRLKELDSAPILSVVTVLFQKNFRDKTHYFIENILKKPETNASNGTFGQF